MHSDTPDSPRITLVISSLGSGGAERVLSTMANHWAEKSREITLITLAGAKEDFYPLDHRITRVPLDLLSASRSAVDAARNNFRRLRDLRHAIIDSRPQVVISFTDRTNVLTLAALLGSRIPIIVSERVDPTAYSAGTGWERARKLFYRRAAAVVVQTNRVRTWAQTLTTPDRVRVIPNPVNIPQTETADKRAHSQLPVPYVLAVGRLVPQKGFDILIRSFAAAAPGCPGHSLVILGEGPERASLLELADQLGISPRVHMPGTVPDVHTWMQHATLFVLSSRFEGFPNALLEAMASGLPCISFDCPSGPAELITNNVDGLLIPPENEELLAAAIRDLLANSTEREQLGRNALQAAQRFSIPAVMAQWDELISRAIQRP